MFGLLRNPKERQRELLSAYLDGRVTPRERAQVERLLAESEEARQDLESLRATVALLRQAPAVQPRRSFRLTPGMVGAPTPSRAAGFARLAAPAVAGVAALFLAFTLAGGATGLFDREAAPGGPEEAPRAEGLAPSATGTPGPAPADGKALQADGAPAPGHVPTTGTPPPGARGPAGPEGPAGPAGPAGAQTDALTSPLPQPTPAPTPTLRPAPTPMATTLERTPAAAPTPTAAPAREESDRATQPFAPASPTLEAAPQPQATPAPLGDGGREFPWVPLQAAAGALTGIAVIATLWQYRRSRAGP